MPCFTAAIINNHPLMRVFVTPFLEESESSIALKSQHAHRALLDTGATASCVSRKVIDMLDLQPMGRRKVFTAGGTVRANLFAVNLHIPIGEETAEGVSVNFRNFSRVEVMETPEHPDFSVIIGMDIIQGGRSLHISGEHFTFCT